MGEESKWYDDDEEEEDSEGENTNERWRKDEGESELSYRDNNSERGGRALSSEESDGNKEVGEGAVVSSEERQNIGIHHEELGDSINRRDEDNSVQENAKSNEDGHDTKFSKVEESIQITEESPCTESGLSNEVSNTISMYLQGKGTGEMDKQSLNISINSGIDVSKTYMNLFKISNRY